MPIKLKIKIVRTLLLAAILFGGAFLQINIAHAIVSSSTQDSSDTTDCPVGDCPVQKQVPVMQDAGPSGTTTTGTTASDTTSSGVSPSGNATSTPPPAGNSPTGSTTAGTSPSGNATTSTASTDPCSLDNKGNQICNPLQVSDLKVFIIKLVKYILGVIALIAVMAIVYAGFLLVASAGNEKVYANARRVIIYAVSGLAISALAYSIIAIVDSVLK